jgi:Domain of unknown function (DUF397)
MTEWRKSPYCESGACVEVARVGNEILVRDSKQDNGPVLRFTLDDWALALKTLSAMEQFGSSLGP